MNASDDALAQALSAVMDGRATPAQWAQVNAAWDRDAALREQWSAWHAGADGLRSAELLRHHRPPQALLEALHAQMPASVVDHPRRRDWFAPFGVAASFVALAVGLVALRPPAADDPTLASAPFPAPGAQGLGGLSFAQAAAGRTLPGWGGALEPALPAQATPAIIDWGQALPERGASAPAP